MTTRYQITATDETTDRSETRVFDTKEEANTWAAEQSKIGRFIQRSVIEFNTTTMKQTDR